MIWPLTILLMVRVASAAISAPLTADNDIYTVDKGEKNENLTERGLQHRVQIFAYLCSKHQCNESNCTMSAMMKATINCMYTASLLSEESLNAQYRFSQRMRFYESTYSNIQLLMFTQMNISTMATAREYIKKTHNLSHTNHDITRHMITDLMFTTDKILKNNTLSMLMLRMKHLKKNTADDNNNNNNNTLPCIPFDPDSWQEIFNDFASESPWYIVLAVLLIIKLIIMYGFHIKHIYEWYNKKPKNCNKQDDSHIEMITYPIENDALMHHQT